MEDVNLKIIKNNQLFEKVAGIIENDRDEATSAAYNAMTESYYLIGQSIVEEEQSGNVWAEYGKAILSDLSIKLTARYGRGFSIRSLRKIRSFYIELQKRQSLTAKLKFDLSYTIYTILLDLTEPHKSFYELLAIKEKMTVRILKDAIRTQTYERYLAKEVQIQNNKHTEIEIKSSNSIAKDPILLDFLGLRKDETFLEKELENLYSQCDN